MAKVCDRSAGRVAPKPDYVRDEDVFQLARRVFKNIDTPLGKAMHDALLKGDADFIANASINPTNYDNPLTYFLDAMVVGLLGKYPELRDLGVITADPETQAKLSFYEAEQQCYETNWRITNYLEGKVVPLHPLVEEVIDKARMYISKAVGRCPAVDDLKLRFGPGATSQTHGESVTLADKLCAYPELTMDSRRYASVLEKSPIWAKLISEAHPESVIQYRAFPDDFGNLREFYKFAPKLTRGDRFTTVPKKATTHRGIKTQPHTLSCIQLAYGTHLSDVIERIGIPKVIAKQVHAEMARQASLTGEFCTVDLASASDTVAKRVVELLWPSDWHECLSELRCAETYIVPPPYRLVESLSPEVLGIGFATGRPRWHVNQQFSAMGCGFTFELETITFYAIARAASDVVDGRLKEPVYCFGDDIIVTSQSSTLLLQTLSFLGFTPNRKKTFVGVGFNESCGGDYFRGQFVRPYFLKDKPDEPHQWMSVCNGITRCRDILTDLGGNPGILGDAWNYAFTRIPMHLRLFGPRAFGDICIWGERSRWTMRRPPRKRVRAVKATDSSLETTLVWLPTDTSSWEVKVWMPKARKRPVARYCNTTNLAVMLYSAWVGGSSPLANGFYSLRGEPEKHVEAWLPCNTVS